MTAADPAFARYASYYDLLYRDKDYDSEARFVASVIGDHMARPGGLDVLDLGSGTGRHARVLAAAGHRIRGIDISGPMVERARRDLALASPEVRSRVEFSEGDVRSFRAGRKYDAAVSLFHVMSYQTTDGDFEAALATARQHLDVGGIFMFDGWYGPGVLTDPPAIRVKRVTGPEFSVLRLSEPEMHSDENVVDVSFTVFICPTPDEVAHVVRERHRMRYWFHPEVAAVAARAGFEVVELSEWMTRVPPRASTWNAYWVLRAR